MSVLNVVYQWFGLRRTSRVTTATFDPATQVGRRAIAFGLHTRPSSDSPISQIEEQERRLLQLYQTLSALAVDGSSISRQVVRLRTAIVEVLDDPRGVLARSLQHWPDGSGVDRQALFEVRDTLRSLADEGEELFNAWGQISGLRHELAKLESRYREDLPNEWRRVALEPRLCEAIASAWSATSIATLTEDVQIAAELLQHRHGILRKELEALRARVPGADSHEPATSDLEAQVLNARALVREQALGQLRTANASVASSSADQLAHLGHRLTNTSAALPLNAKDLHQRQARLREAGEARWSHRKYP